MLRLRTTSSAVAAAVRSISLRAPLGTSSRVALGAVSAARAALATRHSAATSPANGPAADRGARRRPVDSVVIGNSAGGGDGEDCGGDSSAQKLCTETWEPLITSTFTPG